MTLFLSLLGGSFRAIPLMAIVLLGCALFPRSAPRSRHAALAASLAGCLLLPLASHWLPEIALPVLVARPEAVVGGVSPVGSALTSATLGAYRPAAGSLAVVIWLSGVTLFAIRLGAGLIGARRHVAVARRGGRTMKVGRVGRTRVVFSASVAAPMTIGLLCPSVLLPADAVDWSRTRRRAVLRHEFAHIRRGDEWTLLLSRVVRTLHWFNPLVWIAAKRLRTTSEEACDALATDCEMPPLAYAELLVRFARNTEPIRTDGSLMALAGSSRLAVRVRRLVEGGWHPVRPKVAVLAGTAFIAVVLLAAAVRPTFTQQSVRAYAERHDIASSLARQILEAAAAERIAPGIAFGLVGVESGFDATLRSSSGAVGLAQVLPGTAASLQPGITSDALWRPEANLRLGFRLLRGYLDGFAGDLERALLAYAVGPGNVRGAGARLNSSYSARVLRAARAERSRRQPEP